jgi:hypothetical protein
MQRAQFVRALGWLLVLALGGSVVGCGSGAQRPTTVEAAPPTSKPDQIKKFLKSIGKEVARPKAVR